MNNFVISGYVCKGREDRTTQSGRTVTEFTVNCPKYNPTTKESTPRFFACKYWQRDNDFRQAHVQEGALLCLTGDLDYEQWQAKDGTNRSKVVLSVKEIGLVSPPRSAPKAAPCQPPAPSAYQAPSAPQAPYQAPSYTEPGLYGEDIPF